MRAQHGRAPQPSLSPLVLTGLLLLGRTREDPLGVRLVGPVAGVLVAIGYVVVRRDDPPDGVLGPVERVKAAER